jgi:hypothetical protein
VGRYYYLAPWRLVTDDDGATYYAPPEGTIGLVDLRPPEDGSGSGYGFFATAEPLTDSDYTPFGDAAGTRLDALAMDASARSLWASMLGITETIPPGSLLDVLWWTLTTLADPTGEVRARPILPTHRGVLELHLGGHSLVRSRRFGGLDDPAWPVVREQVRASVRQIRLRALRDPHARRDDRGRPVIHRQYLEAMRRKLRLRGEQWRELRAPGLDEDEGPILPTTTITDDFDRANAEALGTSAEGWSWTEVIGDLDIFNNQAIYLNQADSAARAELDLSSDDHYAQVSVTASGGGSTNREVMTRFSSDASPDHDYYRFITRSTSSNTHRLFKVVNGTSTQIGATVDEEAPSMPFTLRGESDGSSHALKIGGVTKITQTDTAITGHLRTGFGASTSPTAAFDNFEAGDLVVPAEAPVSAGSARLLILLNGRRRR